MRERAIYLYQLMQQDLKYCRDKNLPTVSEIECCYQMAIKYWQLLRRELSDFIFKTQEEEIDFFKACKPLFTSEIIFFELVYHLELFHPEDPDKLKNLLAREKNRFSKFVWNNAEFYEYCKTGETKNDETHFVRANSDLSNFKNAPAHDLDEKAATSHDYLVAQLIALERYDKYVEKRIKELIKSEQ